MALSANDYLLALQGLLPQGPAWPRADDAPLTELLNGLAQELARIDQRCDDLLEQSDPRTTYEMLADWEGMAGLPDACWALLGSNPVAARRAALVMRLTGQGGQSAAYFISIANMLGYADASVTEFMPMTCQSVCTAPLNTASAGWPYLWQINLPETRVTVMDCTGACTDSLRDWGDDVLECVIRKNRPAHTTVRFSYGS